MMYNCDFFFGLKALHIFQTLEGSMLSGEVLISGGTNWDLIGRNQVPKGGKRCITEKIVKILKNLDSSLLKPLN